MRRILIGDVHGCYGQLEELLGELNIDSRNDELIFLGDYTDRGPRSYEVYQMVKGLKNQMGDRCVLIRGNHEEMLIEYARKWKSYDMDLWYQNGGKTTTRSFQEAMGDSVVGWQARGEKLREMLTEYTEWLKENATYYYECEDFFATHASIRNDEHPSETVATGDDFLVWDRLSLEGAIYHGKLCFVGHTPLQTPTLSVRTQKGGEYRELDVKKSIVLPKKGLLCIDTCCFRSGRLTAAVVERSGKNNGQVRLRFVQTSPKMISQKEMNDLLMGNF